MTATAQDNGVLRISRKGRCKFAFGDDLPFEVDVVAVFDEWVQIDSSFRNEAGELPPDKVCAYGGSKLSFVQSIVNAAYQTQGTNGPSLSHAEAAEFLAMVQTKIEELRPFFAPKSAGLPSSREHTELRFSQ